MKTGTKDLIVALICIVVLIYGLSYAGYIHIPLALNPSYYEYGVQPKSYDSSSQVGSSYSFPDGAWGRMVGRTYNITEVCREDRIPTAEDIGQGFIKNVTDAGGRVEYVRITRTTDFAYYGSGGNWAFYYVSFTVADCYFVGDPFIVDDIVMIVFILAAAGILLACTFMILYPGVIYSLFGVKPADVLWYNLGQLPVLIPFVIIVVCITAIYLGWFRKKESGKKK